MARKRKYHIPITRSGSSILASIITQWINQPRNKSPAPNNPNGNLGCLFIFAVVIVTAALLSMCSK